MTLTAPHGLYTPDDLYRLLPAVYRIRDVESGGALRELLDVICDQVNAVAESLEQFYDDQFIETCADWVTPYIGDLIGYRTLYGVVPKVASPRAEVANTIGYRRRKGTAAMLEQLARDVTGWPARAVEFFELLAATQYMNHVRPHAAATADLRDANRLALATPFQAGAFESFAHTAEMRRIESGGGRYNIRNVGIFLWRVQARAVTQSPLVDDGSGRRYRFDPLGTDSQLFGNPRPEEEVTHIAEPFDVPLPLTVRWVQVNEPAYHGRDLSILLEDEPAPGVDPVEVTAVDICDLSDDPDNPGSWNNEPAAGDPVVIDPRLGRIAYPDAAPAGTTRLATFHLGSALAIGGGGYDRAADIARVRTVVSADGGGDLTAPLRAVSAGGAVEIADCRRYELPPTITVAHQPDPAQDQATTLRSANRMRPHVSSTEDQIRLDIEPDATLVFDGLLIAGTTLVIDEVDDAAPRHLVIRHCTLVPGLTRTTAGQPVSVGTASLVVLHPFATVTIESSIIGPVIAVEGAEVTISDSVIDAAGRTAVAYCGRAAPGGGVLRTVVTAADRDCGDGVAPGGHLTMGACTVVGRVHAERMDISNSIVLADATLPTDPWPAPLWAERRQVGCVRFSFVPTPARTPRQYECVPRDGVDRGAVPQHTSLRYGDPGYAQLRRATDRAIRNGADDESEMGVTHGLYQPQRETNLAVRLEEYLRFGLEAGFFYAT